MASIRPLAGALSLEGQLLIAMPAIGDPRFDRSVILMCSHGSDGAMGIVVNKLVGNMHLSDLLDQLDIEAEGDHGDLPIHFGGPVEIGRGFVLHSDDYKTHGQTMSVTPAIKLTATLDILRAIATGQGPKRALLALGYAGWAPGQLEEEIQANAWLHCAADEGLIFDMDIEAKWRRALRLLGADANTLSSQAGHA